MTLLLLPRELLLKIIACYPLQGAEFLRLRLVSSTFKKALQRSALHVYGALTGPLLMLLCCETNVCTIESRFTFCLDFSCARFPHFKPGQKNTSLRRLVMRDCLGEEAWQFVDLYVGEQLEHLEITVPMGPPDSYVHSYEEAASEYSEMIRIVPKFTKLKSLFLGSWMQFGGGLLRVLELAAGLPLLEELIIPNSYCSFKKQDNAKFLELMNLVLKLPKLCRLSYVDGEKEKCDNLPKTSTLVFPSCGTLETLELRDVTAVSGLPDLVSLRLFSLHNLVSLACNLPASLVELHLIENPQLVNEYSRNLSYACDAALIAQIPRLASLRVLSCVASPDMLPILPFLSLRELTLCSRGGAMPAVELPAQLSRISFVSSKYYGHSDATSKENIISAILRTGRIQFAHIDWLDVNDHDFMLCVSKIVKHCSFGLQYPSKRALTRPRPLALGLITNMEHLALALGRYESNIAYGTAVGEEMNQLPFSLASLELTVAAYPEYHDPGGDDPSLGDDVLVEMLAQVDEFCMARPHCKVEFRVDVESHLH